MIRIRYNGPRHIVQNTSFYLIGGPSIWSNFTNIDLRNYEADYELLSSNSGYFFFSKIQLGPLA